jgi:hypothetical protein
VASRTPEYDKIALTKQQQNAAAFSTLHGFPQSRNFKQ